MESKIEKIKAIRKIASVKATLSWAKLCELTEFDSFATCFSFGFNWNQNCPDDRLLTMDEKYINMILFNLINFPKRTTAPKG